MTTSPSHSALTLAGLTKRYGGHCVWSDLSFAVAPGTCVGLVGVNGAGKTTLFRSILDLIRVDAGRIDIFGVSHLDTAARRRVAYLPERFLPPSELRGTDYLRYTLALAKCEFDRRSADERARSLHLDSAMLDRPVRQLSKGTAQKLGLLAALLMKKDLYLLDEPMSGLDPVARHDVKQALLELKAGGAAILMSTHALHDVLTVCDRMLVLHGGHIRFDGAPVDFLARSQARDADDAFVSLLGAHAPALIE